MKNLGELIKEKRINKGFTLRKFCLEIKADPSNWSKIERGLVKFPTKSVLDEVSKVLELSDDEINEIKELSIIQTISNESDLEERVLQALPVFFRTTRDIKPSEKQLNELIDIIRKN